MCRVCICLFVCLLIIIINNNNRFLYSAFPNYDQSASQCIITPVIEFRINSALRVHFLHSLGSIRPVAILPARTMPTQPQYRSHPTGSPFNTWVESSSSNVDKVFCWRTQVPGDSGIRTRGAFHQAFCQCFSLTNLLSANQTVGFEPGLSTWEPSGHTTIPRHLHHVRLFVFSSVGKIDKVNAYAIIIKIEADFDILIQWNLRYRPKEVRCYKTL